MKNIYFLLLITIFTPLALLAQNENNSAESIQFPTIKNDETIDLDNPMLTKCGNAVSDSTAQQSRKYPLVTGKNSSFYTDIILGGAALLLGLIGWQVYQKIGQRKVEMEN